MSRAEVGELVEEPVAAFLFKLREERVGGEHLKIGNGARKLRPGNHGVKVVVENHPGVNPEAFVFATIRQRTHQEVAACGGGKERQPFEDG